MTRASFLIALFAVFVALVSAGTRPEDKKWLEAKAQEEGVVATGTGLLYKEITPGTGKTPTVSSPCDCHYRGTLIDGTE